MAISQTDLVPQLVDAVRNLPFVGPDRMAALEDAYYTVQDKVTLFIYDRTHAPVVVSNVVGTSVDSTGDPSVQPPSDPSDSSAAATPLPATQTAVAQTPAASRTTPTPGSTRPALPLPIRPIILSDPQDGEGVWSPVGMPLGNRSRPPLVRTFFRPDPERPYVRVDLVWVDLSQTQLTLVPGTVEPRSTAAVRRDGVIPADVQLGGNLLAAWNGGFLTLHGAYGMMVNRTLIAPPRDGFAVLAQYVDGTQHIGVWGRDVKMSPDLVSFRENGPILIDRGVLNQDGLLAWGKSISGETHIWRSGIGITRDGALIYAAGNALSAQALGIALQRAGAVEAMQLDVNSWHVFFFTYQMTPQGLLPTKLNTGMSGNNKMYLTPYDRDFMYLTLRSTLPGAPPVPGTPLPTLRPTPTLPPNAIDNSLATPDLNNPTPFFTP